MNTDRFYIECDCDHPEHVIRVTKNREDSEIYLEYFLSPEYSVIQRIWIAIKYVFGFKTVYGHFGEIALNKAMIEKITEEFSEYLNDISIEDENIQSNLELLEKFIRD